MEEDIDAMSDDEQLNDNNDNKNTVKNKLPEDEKMNDDGSDIRNLVESGIQIKIDHSPNHMHHKYMIVDELRVLTGSYNWTRSAAQYNQENIIITDNDDIVTGFIDNFSQLWETTILLTNN